MLMEFWELREDPHGPVKDHKQDEQAADLGRGCKRAKFVELTAAAAISLLENIRSPSTIVKAYVRRTSKHVELLG